MSSQLMRMTPRRAQLVRWPPMTKFAEQVAGAIEQTVAADEQVIE